MLHKFPFITSFSIMEPTIELPHFYFQYQVNWLRFLGIEVLIKNESYFYKVYSYFMLAFTGLYVFVECIEVCFHRDFTTLVVCCNYAISHFLGMIKVVVLYRNRKKIGDLLTSLHEGRFSPNLNRTGTFERKCIRKIYYEAHYMNIIYGLTIVIVVGLGIYQAGITRLTKPQEMWALSFAPISIVNTKFSPMFEIAYIYQAIGVILISLCVWSSDVTVVSVIAQMGAQVKILERSLREYNNRGIRKQKKEKDMTVAKSKSIELKEAIDYHINILDTVDTVEYLCSYLVLCVFLANLILLCLLMYYTSLMPLHSLAFIQYLVYCFLIAIQIFLFCWWGNELTLANEYLALAAAETYTPDEPIFHAKSLKLMMIRAQRPLFLTAGKFAPLSLDTYKGIIKGSFSYFMVLRQVNTDTE